ncbi:Uncharacterized protein Adt_02928 [Abeliophyllum distichum]|uniref:Uncharacterized protein n=1 Tax=Abeliophyllum distichum TaxID=126358 RepID=A0ABD1VX16_9LAMI
MKFPTSWGVGCVRGDQQASRRCYVYSISIKNTVMMLDLERPNGRIEPLELTEDVIIAKDQVLKIGGGHASPRLRRAASPAPSLKDINGKPLGRPWNAEHLKKYYQ